MSSFEAWFEKMYDMSWKLYCKRYNAGEFVYPENPYELRKAWNAGKRASLKKEAVEVLEFYADPEMHIIREKTDRRTYYNECSIVHADGGRRAQAVLKKIRGRK